MRVLRLPAKTFPLVVRALVFWFLLSSFVLYAKILHDHLLEQVEWSAYFCGWVAFLAPKHISAVALLALMFGFLFRYDSVRSLDFIMLLFAILIYGSFWFVFHYFRTLAELDLVFPYSEFIDVFWVVAVFCIVFFRERRLRQRGGYAASESG